MTWPNRFLFRIRWWILTGIIALGAIGIVYVRLSPKISDGFRNPPTYLASIAIVLLLIVWFLIFGATRWRTRLGVLAIVVALVVGAGMLLRIDGLYGDFTPQLRWRWSPPEDYQLAQGARIGDGGKAGAVPIDLTRISPADFPRFLGPQGRPVIAEVALNRDWSNHPPRELWRQPIGAGWSAFSLVGNYALTQEQRGDDEQVTCYELRTGRLLWTHSDRLRFKDMVSGDGPRATPAVDGGKVYAMGAAGLLNCLEGATGKTIWSRDVLAGNKQKNLIWGMSCSPLVVDHLVVVSPGNSGPSLAAYDKNTGKPIWLAGHDRASYVSPALATLAGRRQILSVNAESVTGHDPLDGHLLWEYAWPGKSAKCSQPVPLEGDRIFLSAGYGVGCVLLQVSAEQDGQLKAKEVWRKPELRTRYNNVVVRGGFVYGLDEGVLACLELATGRRMWKAGNYGHGQMLLFGDVILVTTETGGFVLVEATPAAHHELARFSALKGKTWNCPAFSAPCLLVRNDKEAACYELSVSSG